MDAIRDKVALVTGGGRGIGRAIALALARRGAKVAVAARTASEVEAVAGELRALGVQALAVPGDLSRREEPAALAARVAGALGPVDLLVNNAGVDASGPVQRIDDATWDRVLAVNLTAPFLLVRACLPGMLQRGFGRILNVASVAGKIGLKYGAAYSASKHALVGLTRSIAAECGRKGVTCNALAPSWTETRMMDEAMAAIARATGRSAAEARELVLRQNPLGRAATPEEVAEAALAVLANPAIHGQCIHVDGGEVMA
ncbi:MAG TPA: SDR family NAD(P)-dependent oxidoreductase [Anaeromyxobacteraceae bacterium]|nr:SDR family NAD(P)-dependent oxidoreductase [Anaeromyxobacteraceae bacterium]